MSYPMLFGKTEQIELEVEGMTCQHCVQHVEEALTGVKGVKEATVELEQGRATVRVKEGTGADALTQAISDAGYGAQILG